MSCDKFPISKDSSSHRGWKFAPRRKLNRALLYGHHTEFPVSSIHRFFENIFFLNRVRSDFKQSLLSGQLQNVFAVSSMLAFKKLQWGPRVNFPHAHTPVQYGRWQLRSNNTFSFFADICFEIRTYSHFEISLGGQVDMKWTGRMFKMQSPF